MWAAKSVGSDKSKLMQQVVEHWFDERLEMPICVPDPGDVGVRVEWRCERAAGWGRYNHAGLFGDQFGAQIVRMAAMAGGDAALCGKPLHKRAEVGDEAVLTGREAVKLAASTRILIFKNSNFAMLAREDAIAKFLIQRGQYITGTGEKAADGCEAVS